MSDPVVLRVVRPYTSEQELLGAEGWTIGMKRVVLIGERPLKRGTLVQVELVLTTGEKLLRAEGKVLGMAKARSDRAKGLEVRLKRYGGSTKRFLERALEASNATAPTDQRSLDSEPALDSSPRTSSLEIGSPAAEQDLDVEVELVSQVELLEESEPVPLAPASAREGAEAMPDSDRSGVRMRVIQPPPDRDALLERLRERGRRIANGKLEG